MPDKQQGECDPSKCPRPSIAIKTIDHDILLNKQSRLETMALHCDGFSMEDQFQKTMLGGSPWLSHPYISKENTSDGAGGMLSCPTATRSKSIIAYMIVVLSLSLDQLRSSEGKELLDEVSK